LLAGQNSQVITYRVPCAGPGMLIHFRPIEPSGRCVVSRLGLLSAVVRFLADGQFPGVGKYPSFLTPEFDVLIRRMRCIENGPMASLGRLRLGIFVWTDAGGQSRRPDPTPRTSDRSWGRARRSWPFFDGRQRAGRYHSERWRFKGRSAVGANSVASRRRLVWPEVPLGAAVAVPFMARYGGDHVEALQELNRREICAKG
jgi:hypothetical protein